MLTWTPSSAIRSIQAGTLSLRVSQIMIGIASQALQMRILFVHDLIILAQYQSTPYWQDSFTLPGLIWRCLMLLTTRYLMLHV